MSVLTSFSDHQLFVEAPQATDSHSVPRSTLIDAIKSHNAKITPSFLADFSDDELSRYLQHLEWGDKPRLSAGAWRELDNAAAIECAEVD